MMNISIRVLFFLVYGTWQANLRTGRYSTTETISDSYFEGMCSSSWAVTVAMVATDEYNGKGDNTAGIIAAPGKDRLSYQYLMECCADCYLPFGFDNGCNGGDFIAAMDYVVTKGLPTGSNKYGGSALCSNYKLRECANNPEAVTPNIPACISIDLDISIAFDTCSLNTCRNNGVTFSAINMTSKNVVSGTNAVQAMCSVLDGTPGRILIVEIRIFEDFMRLNSPSQIYVHTWGRYMGKLVVAIYGYETDTTSGQEYWVVRLPWGKSFGGDGGYVKMLKGVNNCGIENIGRMYYFIP